MSLDSINIEDWENRRRAHRRRWWSKLLAELLVSILLGLLIGVLFTAYIGDITRLGFCAAVAATFIVAWLIAKIESRQSMMDFAVSDRVDDLLSEYPSAPGLVRAFLLHAINEAKEDLKTLKQKGHPDLNAGDRLQIARSIVIESRIRTYDATSLDPPYTAQNTHVDFIKDQKTRLAGKYVRRLLIFPKDELLEALKYEENRTRMKDFLKLHNQLGDRAQLQYLPCTPEQLKDIVTKEFGYKDDPMLLDFGVVNGSDGRIVWGQALGSGNSQGLQQPKNSSALAALDGPVAIRTHTDGQRYLQLFEKLWEFNTDRAREAYPYFPESQSQLEAYVWIAEMQSRVGRKVGASETPSPHEWNGALYDKVKNSSLLCAVDAHPKRWTYDNDYIELLAASVSAASRYSNNGFHRIFVLRETFSQSEGATFFDNVVVKHAKAGIQVSLVSWREPLKRNFPIVDCILGSDGWGLYLWPCYDEHLSQKREYVPSHYEIENKADYEWLRVQVFDPLMLAARIRIKPGDSVQIKRSEILKFLSNPSHT